MVLPFCEAGSTVTAYCAEDLAMFAIGGALGL